jgi:DNA (cytosine-5)-methyltransferase 1
MPSMDEFLRVKEAAELLRVAPNTVRAWGDRGKIPEYRHPANNYRLYRRSDLEELIRQIEESATNRPRKPR